ncbi:hypothetical protein PVK06_042782 [Gossypium arboreum]|uniref:RNase H type-1 domain-containing protein n=1 Tax=Gossypium arboreum TaxID=29729 RepID=A0ABR0MNH9_GOSAR|nr:hypothetical protein PVK06_042782 [Gossypium arboreum]
MATFREVLEECQLIDVGYTGACDINGSRGNVFKPTRGLQQDAINFRLSTAINSMRDFKSGLPGCLSSLPLVNVAFSIVHFGPYGEIETKEYMKRELLMERKLQTSSVSTLLNLLVSKKISIVVRNAEGKIILSCSEIYNGITSIFAAEGIAYWKAVQIGAENGWQSIIFEGDSLAIIKKCNTKGQDRSLVGAYIYDIQQKINGYNNIRFKHTLRSAKTLAHILATETLKRQNEIYLEMKVLEYTKKQKRFDWMCEPD